MQNNIFSALSDFEDSINPEVSHARAGFHPGFKWYIKTIIPGPRILNDDTHPLFLFWCSLESRHKNTVKLTPLAFNWHGKEIDKWWTIWLDHQTDIEVSYTRIDGLKYTIIDFDQGLKNSAENLENWLKKSLNPRQSTISSVSYSTLTDTINFLKTYTSNKRSTVNRLNLKVITNEKNNSTAIDQYVMDFVRKQ